MPMHMCYYLSAWQICMNMDGYHNEQIESSWANLLSSNRVEKDFELTVENKFVHSLKIIAYLNDAPLNGNETSS